MLRFDQQCRKQAVTLHQRVPSATGALALHGKVVHTPLQNKSTLCSCGKHAHHQGAHPNVPKAVAWKLHMLQRCQLLQRLADADCAGLLL